MELEVPVPSQNAFKRRRKEDYFNSELTAVSLPCEEESFHILAGIISLNVINQVISSYQNPTIDQPGLPDLTTLSKIHRLWRQNLSKIGGLPISTSVKVQPVINRVSTRLLEECPPIPSIQGRRVKPQTTMENCINQENPNASIMNIDSLGIEKRITLSSSQHADTNGKNSDQEHLSTSGNSQPFISNRLGLARAAAKKRTKKRRIIKINDDQPHRGDSSSSSSQFDILPGMTILIQQSSDLSIRDWKRKYCTTVDDNFTLQIEPQRPSSLSSSSSSSSSSSASLWISGAVQKVQRLWDSLHKTTLPLPSILSPNDKKMVRQKYSHVLMIRLKDGSIMKVFWPDHEILRFPSMEIQERTEEVGLENNKALASEGGGESKPAAPTAMELQLLQEMFSDSDASDDHSHNGDNSGSDSDDSASCSGFMELLHQHSSPVTEQPSTASNVQEDEVYKSSLHTIGGTDNIVPIPSKEFSSILSSNIAEDVLLSTAGQRVTKRQIDEIEERFERWKSGKNMPIFKVLPHNDPTHSVEDVIEDDSDLEGSFPAPDVIIIGETEKLTKKNHKWIVKLENVYIRFCQPTAYEVVIPSLKCSMNASAFEKGDSSLTTGIPRSK